MSDTPKTIGDLIQDSRNANRGTAKGQKMLVGSIQRSKLGRSIVIDRNNQIIGGNKTVEAVAEVLGVDAKIKVIEDNGDELIVRKRLDLDLSDPDPNNPARQLAHSDNLVSYFNYEADLPNFAADLERGFKFEDIDVTVPDLGRLLGPAAEEMLGGGDWKETEAQVSRADELQEVWKVQPGQMFALGDHRLICGDCTDRAVVDRVMAGERAAATITDPPYNVGIDYANDDNDDKSQENYKNFTQKWFNLAREFSDKQIITPGCNNLALWLKSFDAFYVASWIKTNAMTHGFVSRFFCWEPILFFGGEWFKGNEKMWKRKRANDVFNYPVSEQSMPNGDSLTPLHPCPKPIKLIEDFLENYTEKNDIILEPFLGSGTTLIACHNLGRKLRGIEISPAYCSVVLQRFLDHTGIQPVLLSE